MFRLFHGFQQYFKGFWEDKDNDRVDNGGMYQFRYVLDQQRPVESDFIENSSYSDFVPDENK